VKPAKPPLPPLQDLGFGDRVVRESRQRLLHRDGTFNVRREGLGFFESWTAYEYLITTGWPRFLFLVVIGYAVTNALFAFAFWACGPAAIAGPEEHLYGVGRYLEDYFFSVQTLATIGYGHLRPNGLLPNLIVALESLVGLLGIALVTGLAFARFARPAVGIRFSDHGVIAPYLDGRGFMFRVVNTHQSELVNAQARVILARRKPGHQGAERELIPIALERDTIVFFPLSWTIVHPITEESPLHGVTERGLRDWDAEFLVMLTALDETSYQIVHARSSYRAEEIVFGAKFKSMLGQNEDGTFSVDVRALSAIERVADARAAAPAGTGAGTRVRP
jgi:inward rectifier potassium channel